MQAVIRVLAHHADRHHQAIAADFRDERLRRIDGQPQKLKGTTLWQVLLELPTDCDYFLRRARVAQELEQKVNRFCKWSQRRGPTV